MRAAQLLVLIVALLPSVAGGESARPLEPPRRATAPEPLCFCWNEGRKIDEGASACIRTTLGRRLAVCGRVLNLMSWQVSEQPCAES